MRDIRPQKQQPGEAARPKLRLEQGGTFVIAQHQTEDRTTKRQSVSKFRKFGKKLQQRGLPEAATNGDEKWSTLEINLDFTWPLRSIHSLLKLVRTFSKRRRFVIIIVIVVLCCVISVSYIVIVRLHHPANSPSLTGGSQQQATGPTPGTPKYPTLLPAGKSIHDLGGWYRISPPDRDAVYAYADSIGTIHIDVSEQPIPASFKPDIAESVAELARSFDANQKLSVSDLTVYIGTSAKGPQSLIFVKSNTLILIRSVTIVNNNQWLQYIESLH